MAKGRGRKGRTKRVVSARRRPDRGPSPELLEALTASEYTRQWDAVWAWAGDVIGAADEVPADVQNERITKRRGLYVADIEDNEEAYERGVPLEQLDIPRGPDQHEGGRRRVIIRLYTWAVDLVAGSVYEPRWITWGFGRTALMASDVFLRRVREYQFAVSKGIESRRLVATAIEVAWWTKKEGSELL